MRRRAHTVRERPEDGRSHHQSEQGRTEDKAEGVRFYLELRSHRGRREPDGLQVHAVEHCDGAAQQHHAPLQRTKGASIQQVCYDHCLRSRPLKPFGHDAFQFGSRRLLGWAMVAMGRVLQKPQ
jgi:hypothetical protein